MDSCLDSICQFFEWVHAMQIIVADDHALVRDMLDAFLKQLDQDVRVLPAANLAQALELARTTESLDLVLLDLRMPGMNGLAGLQSMRQQRPGVPVVILSGEINPAVIRDALQAGAAGFLPKTMRGTAMVNALRLVLSGERYVPDTALPTPGAPPPATADPGGEGLAALTAREREVLALLVEGQSNKTIAGNLGIEVVTVALHLRSIYRKLGVDSRTQAVRHALQSGWQA